MYIIPIANKCYKYVNYIRVFKKIYNARKIRINRHTRYTYIIYIYYAFIKNNTIQ